METTIRRQGHALIFPPSGEVVFATDLHGHVEDFRRVVEVYRERKAAGRPVYLLFGGDFVHGPCYPRDEWPDFLGDYTADHTVELFFELEALLARDPNVFMLLGNHEHAHIGGPHTSKFHQDPDEVEFLESELGAEGTARLHALLRSLPLVALSPSGVLFMHGAPSVAEAGFHEVSEVSLDGYAHLRIHQVYDVPIIGELLWAKWAEPARADLFLRRMSFESITPRVAVYGHDIIQEGFERTPPNQLIVSTSFGLHRKFKTLCIVDLEGSYASVDDFREGVELVPLYPESDLSTAEIGAEPASNGLH